MASSRILLQEKVGVLHWCIYKKRLLAARIVGGDANARTLFAAFVAMSKARSLRSVR
jgi:hypothetical protein